MKKIIYTMLCLIAFSMPNIAQVIESDENDNGMYTDLGADFFSSYVWRGMQIDASPNIQGWGEFGIFGLKAGIWASSNFNGTFSETDFYVGYDIGNFGVSLTDYFIGNDNFFSFKKEETIHVGELILNYTISESFPLQISAGLVVYGDDFKIDSYDLNGDPVFSDKKNYSNYFELTYPLTVGNTEIGFIIGGTASESYFLGSDDAAIINTGISLAKEIRITDKYSLPISFSFTVNPHTESIYSVFGISF